MRRDAAFNGQDFVFPIIKTQTEKLHHFLVSTGQYFAPVKKFFCYIFPHGFGIKNSTGFSFYQVYIMFQTILGVPTAVGTLICCNQGAFIKNVDIIGITLNCNLLSEVSGGNGIIVLFITYRRKIIDFCYSSFAGIKSEFWYGA